MADTRTQRRIDARLDDLYTRYLPTDERKVVQYYAPGREYYAPQLAGAERDTFGISIADLDGGVYGVGDHEQVFALQSLSKILAYGLALTDHGRDTVMEHVGVEPSGDAFYAIRLQRDHLPYNPMVNAGAIATSNLVRGADPDERVQRILDLTRRLAGNDSLQVDEDVFAQELRTADRNTAIAYLMRSQGVLRGDVGEALSVYLRQCSITVTCDDVARIGASLANGGRNPVTGDRPLQGSHVRDILSVMFTCGMYDYAGEWAFDVGVPAKSAVSGGLLAVVPDKLGLGVFSPGLDEHGHTVRGIEVCEEVSNRLGLHLFARDEDDAILGTSAPAPMA